MASGSSRPFRPRNRTPKAPDPAARSDAPKLDPNAAVFVPKAQASSSNMNYDDLMYYNFGTGYQETETVQTSKYEQDRRKYEPVYFGNPNFGRKQPGFGNKPSRGAKTRYKPRTKLKEKEANSTENTGQASQNGFSEENQAITKRASSAISPSSQPISVPRQVPLQTVSQRPSPSQGPSPRFRDPSRFDLPISDFMENGAEYHDTYDRTHVDNNYQNEDFGFSELALNEGRNRNDYSRPNLQKRDQNFVQNLPNRGAEFHVTDPVSKSDKSADLRKERPDSNANWRRQPTEAQNSKTPEKKRGRNNSKRGSQDARVNSSESRKTVSEDSRSNRPEKVRDPEPMRSNRVEKARDPERTRSNRVEKARDSEPTRNDRDFASKKEITIVNSKHINFRKNTTKVEVESQRSVLVEELMNSTYECMVCCDVIRREVAVWSCRECFHIFHLYCIKKWARSPSALVEGTDTGWRCPGCQNVTEKVPNYYKCFCGKQRDPTHSPYETPHSCGEVCGRNRGGNCKHSCNILCHPGPCPACRASINKSCNCGKTSRTVQCSRGTDVKCDAKCGKELNCGKHVCERICHAGECSACDKLVGQYCYCGKAFRQVRCGSDEHYQDVYCCGEICGEQLSCGNHSCTMICHEDVCMTCQWAPENALYCNCGKSLIADIPDAKERESCTDPIPSCGKICDKELPCGPENKRHRCSMICHEGSCQIDDGDTIIFCRCGASSKEISCKEAQQYLNHEVEFLCNRRCNKKKECSKHRCQNTCCVEENHSCTQICGRKLTCGLHRCEEQCHRGNCQNCWNVNFDEVTCHCGASVLEPPVSCGTKPPECRQVCQRQHACNHTVRHNCHHEERCPPCTELTKRLCMGEHETRHNIPCHITDISCGLRCGKPLPCREHRCIKTCHKGPCFSEEDKCEQPCTKVRAWCEHACGAPCHAGQQCPETPCEAQIKLTCACGNRSEMVACAAGKRDTDVKIYQQMTNSAMVGKIIYVGNGQTVDLYALNAKKRQLDCSEECAKIERNRRLALALQIENPELSDKLGAPNYTEFLRDFAKLNPSFAADIERALADLVQSAKVSKYPNRSHSFKPMKRDQRRFIHEIAEFYGCKTQSYDYEPVKSVVATAYKGKCWMPSMTLTAAIKRQTQPSAPLPIPHNSTEKDIRAKSVASRQSTSVITSDDSSKKDSRRRKFVDYFDFEDED